jgi:hypothetical protein
MGPLGNMRAVPFKAAAQYVGGLVIAAFFVVLLSFTFSFLGTIFCAALAGMMLGALRTHKWQSVPVSLLFPLVIFILLRGMKTELSERQVLLVSLACFSIFWLTYGVGAALFFFERKGPSSTGHPAQAQSVCAARPEGESVTERVSAGGAEVPKHNGWLSLDMLQGTWAPDASAPAQVRNWRMSIQQEELTLSEAQGGGQVKILAIAQLKLCATDARPTLLVSKPDAEASPDSSVSS